MCQVIVEIIGARVVVPKIGYDACEPGGCRAAVQQDRELICLGLV
jgi:hypothetical protein